MRPIYRVLADGADITAALADRLQSLTVTDEAGEQTDTLTIVLDDRGNRIALPRRGAELVVSLGYAQQGLHRVGLYVVDEVEPSGPPDQLTIRAKAANMQASLKAPKTRAWDDVTLGQLVATVAAEHGLEPVTGDFLADIHIPHLPQTEESDLHLLTRLGRQYDAQAKPVDGRLLFTARADYAAASGKTAPAIPIARGDTSSHRFAFVDRDKYAAVVAHWHDTATGERVPARAGAGEPVSTLRHTYPDAGAAQAAAQARLEALQRGQATGSLSLPVGNPRLVAGQPVTLSGFRSEIDGDWIVSRATHTLAGNGLRTQLSLETPK